MMTDKERLMECVKCANLEFCILEDSECEDENGHCTCFRQIKEQHRE